MIPEQLHHKLASYRAKLWRQKLVEAVIAGLLGLIFSFLLIYVIDRFFATPVFVRILILFSGASIPAFFVPYWMHRWLWKRRKESQLAELIGSKFPGLGDRLLGALELEMAGVNDTASPELKAAALKSIDREAAKRDFDEALPKSFYVKLSIALVGLVLIVSGTFIFAPEASFNALQRWFLPLSDTPRYTFTRLEDLPDRLVVPKGESFVISLTLAKDSKRQPKLAAATYNDQEAVKAVLKNGAYHFSFPQQQNTGMAYFTIGDFRHTIQIEPKYRPRIEALSAMVSYPDYLKIPQKHFAITRGSLSVPIGSEISLKVEADRPLKRANYLAGAGEKSQQIEARNFSGNIANFSAINVAEGDVHNLAVKITDHYALESVMHRKLSITSIADEAPDAYLRDVEDRIAILPEEVIDFSIMSQDDFGLQGSGFEWHGIAASTKETEKLGEIELLRGGPEIKELAGKASFSPAAFNLKPQTLLLRAYTQDFHPDRDRQFSKAITIFVLTKEEHIRLLEQRFEQQVMRLADLLRNEQELYDENQRIERLKDQEFKDSETASRLDQQERLERKNAERAESIAKAMEELLADANRNENVDLETMENMAEIMENLREMGKEDLPSVADQLSKSRESSKQPEAGKKELQAAISQQQTLLEKLQDTLDKASVTEKQMEAETFVVRLREASKQQDKIAGDVVGGLEQFIGLRHRDVDPRDQRLLKRVSGQQERAMSAVSWLIEDLNFYQLRSKKPAYKTIADQMVEQRIEAGLLSVKKKIEGNLSSSGAILSKQWAEQLTKWADLLENNQNQGGSGGGGQGGGKPNNEDDDFEFMLRVMKLVQDQQDYRGQTRVLEQLKRKQEKGSSE